MSKLIDLAFAQIGLGSSTVVSKGVCQISSKADVDPNSVGIEGAAFITEELAPADMLANVAGDILSIRPLYIDILLSYSSLTSLRMSGIKSSML